MMHRFFRATAVAVGLFAGVAAHAQSCPTPANVNEMANDLAQGVAQTRAANGAAAIAIDPRLMAAAQRQACDMAVHGGTGHRASDGTNSDDRVAQAGFRSCQTAEDIGWGFSQAGQMISTWMTSPGHRANLLLGGATHFGVGVAQGGQGPVWVYVVARAC